MKETTKWILILVASGIITALAITVIEKSLLLKAIFPQPDQPTPPSNEILII